MSSATNSSGQTQTYQYDVNDRLVQAGGTTLSYDGSRITYESSASGDVSYLLGLRVEGTSGPAGSTASQAYLYDGLGNVVNDNKSYDAYGGDFSTYYTPIYGNGQKTGHYGYKGYYTDSFSGMCYLGARWYDPGLSRFTQEDPARDGLNWYSYCNGDPVNYFDPTGLFTSLIHLTWTNTWAIDYLKNYFSKTLAESLAKIFAEADNRMDSGSTNPVTNPFYHWGQSWHFNINSNNPKMIDSRQQRFNECLNSAINYLKNKDTNAAIRELGRGLHALQDMIAHSGTGGNVRVSLYGWLYKRIGFLWVPYWGEVNYFYMHVPGKDDFKVGDANFMKAKSKTEYVLGEFVYYYNAYILGKKLYKV